MLNTYNIEINVIVKVTLYIGSIWISVGLGILLPNLLTKHLGTDWIRRIKY